MAVIAIRNFMGEIPKLVGTPHLLPEGAAQYAENCDFSTGSLVPLRGPSASLRSAIYGPIRAMYFRDDAASQKWLSYTSDQMGATFQSPVTDDTFKRVYYVQRQNVENGPTVDPSLRCVQWDYASTAGGIPVDGSGNYTGMAVVGIPAPTTKPTLTLEELTSAIPGVTTPLVEIKGWWEADGVRHQETVLLASTPPSPGATFMRSWTVTAPTPIKTVEVDPDTDEETETGTPTEAVFAASLTLKDGETLLFSVASSTSATAPARSSALPGGVELTIKKTNVAADNYQYTLTLSWGVVETRAYVFTVVNDWNEEGPPSPAELVSLNYLQKVLVKCPLPAMRTQVAYGRYYQKRKAGAAGVNVYRTFGGSANYLKITHGTGSTYDRTTAGAVLSASEPSLQYPPSQGEGAFAFIYDDIHTPNPVGTLLQSTMWTPPPDGDSTGQPEGLTLLPNGWFAMFKGNTLYMSEPYRPHAWPYSMTFPTNIKCICVGAQALVVGTQDSVYIVNGSHPAAVSQMRLPIPVGGVSQRGIVNVEGAVAMVTNDGILLITGSQASLDFSQKLFTRAEWRSRYSSVLTSLRLSYHDGFLLGTTATASGFVVRVDEAGGSFSRLTTNMYTATNNPLTDTLQYTTPQDGTGRNVYEFRGSTTTNLDATWWSKEYIFPKPERMGAFYLRCSASVVLIVYADGAIYHTATYTAGTHRLPAASIGGQPGFAYRWSVKMYTNGTISEFIMAQSPSELKNA